MLCFPGQAGRSRKSHTCRWPPLLSSSLFAFTGTVLPLPCCPAGSPGLPGSSTAVFWHAIRNVFAWKPSLTSAFLQAHPAPLTLCPADHIKKKKKFPSIYLGGFKVRTVVHQGQEAVVCRLSLHIMVLQAADEGLQGGRDLTVTVAAELS